ncbi:MAG TPA: hypothetical protein VHT91_00465 [Kofleriaceae bacterium]|nr:hypothetical protein [Kofleriaceae bacterium]
MFASPESRTQPPLPAALPGPAEVVNLPSPGLPADHGLASLGLVMQLAGRTTAALVALLASLAWLDGRLDRYGASHTAWLGLAIALCIARSQLHRVAGRDLAYGRRWTEGDPFDATRTYCVLALGQAVAIGAIAARVFDQPWPAAAGITAALSLWPCALAVIFYVEYRSRPLRVEPLRAGLPLGEDRGLEGASILMTVLGAYGVVSTGGIVVMLGALSPHHVQHGWGVMLLVVFALLVVRSSLQIRAGLAGLRDSSFQRSFDRPCELAGRYAAFGVISAFCVGGVLVLLAMAERLTPDAILSVAVACWLLITWPMIVKRYFSQRQFAELLAGDRVTHRRAPDAGLTALGWLLAGHATLVAAVVILQLTGHPRLGPQLGRVTDHALVLSGLAVGRWWLIDAGLAVASVVLELAAAAALIRMSDQRRAITTIYAVFAGVVALGPAVPVLASLGHQLSIWTGIQLLPSAVQLVMPVAALLLVHRAVIPAARVVDRTPRRSDRQPDRQRKFPDSM